MNILTKTKMCLKNLLGCKTRRKIVVIHVDDYGSIRVKDIASRERLNALGIPMESSRYFRWETLCTTEDLQKLFEVLTSVKDSHGHHACFTPFANIANPDFEKIRASGFEHYYREPFTETLKRYGKPYEGAYELWKQGISEGIFHPEYHGTEHISVRRFMRALQAGVKSVRLAFDHECVSLPGLPGEAPVKYLSSVFNIEAPEDNELLDEAIRQGCRIFSETLGYLPRQFTPGNGAHSMQLNPALYECGIRYVNSGRRWINPLGNGQFEKHFYWTGRQDRYGMKYIVRNCVFEPFLNDCSLNANAAENCLANVEAAFRMHMPAIISSHRVNFSGGIDTVHRDESLRQLKVLLQEIVHRWPEVEFMDSSKMADEIL